MAAGKRVRFGDLTDDGPLKVTATADLPPTAVPVAECAPNPDNPRDADLDVAELAASMREVGQLQPGIIVSRAVFVEQFPQHAEKFSDGVRWVVVNGNRRLAAAQEIGARTFECRLLDNLGTAEAIDSAVMIENLHRLAIAPLHEAEFLARMVRQSGSQRKVATRIGKTQGYVSQRIALLDLHDDLKALLRTGDLSVKLARHLATLPVDEQLDAWKAANVAQTVAAPSPPAAAESAGEETEPKPAGTRLVRIPIGPPKDLAERLLQHLTDEDLTELLRLLQLDRATAG